MKLFKTVKIIKSKEGVLHFKRFAIIECKLFNIYIHWIYKADEDEHLHDHPWNYTSIVLSGKFWEAVKNTKENENKYEMNNLSSGSISSQKAERTHKVYMLLSKKIITLFFTGPRFREWGYDVDGKWIDNVTYRKMKNEGKL